MRQRGNHLAYHAIGTFQCASNEPPNDTVGGRAGLLAPLEPRSARAFAVFSNATTDRFETSVATQPLSFTLRDGGQGERRRRDRMRE